MIAFIAAALLSQQGLSTVKTAIVLAKTDSWARRSTIPEYAWIDAGRVLHYTGTSDHPVPHIRTVATGQSQPLPALSRANPFGIQVAPNSKHVLFEEGLTFFISGLDGNPTIELPRKNMEV